MDEDAIAEKVEAKVGCNCGNCEDMLKEMKQPDFDAKSFLYSQRQALLLQVDSIERELKKIGEFSAPRTSALRHWFKDNCPKPGPRLD